MIGAWQAATMNAIVAPYIGWRGLVRSAIVLPTIVPIPNAVTMIAQLEAPSSSRSAITGPEGEHAGQREQVVGGERRHERPHPAPRADLGDAALEVGAGSGSARARAARASTRSRGEEGGADTNVPASSAMAMPGPATTISTPAERRAEHHPDVLGDAHERVRLLEVLAAGDVGDQAARGGPEAGLERAVERDEDDDVPELGACR